jgi:hypothetical protein
VGRSCLWFLGRDGDVMTLILVCLKRDGTDPFYVWFGDIKSGITSYTWGPFISFFLFFLPSSKFPNPTPYRNFWPELVPNTLARTYASRGRCSPLGLLEPLLAPRRRGTAARSSSSPAGRSSSSRLLEARPRRQVAFHPLCPRAGALSLRSPAGAPRRLLFFLSLVRSNSCPTFARPVHSILRGRDIPHLRVIFPLGTIPP